MLTVLLLASYALADDLDSKAYNAGGAIGTTLGQESGYFEKAKAQRECAEAFNLLFGDIPYTPKDKKDFIAGCVYYYKFVAD